MTRLVFEVGIDRRVHSRDEEAGNRCDVIHRLALGSATLKALNERFGDLLVVLNRKDHRHIYVDAPINGFFNGGQTFLSCRDLDHYILAAEALEQAIGLFNCPLRVVSQARADFQTDIPVQAIRPVIHGLQDIRGATDVVSNQRLVDVLDAQTRTDQRTQLLIVVRRAGNRFFKNGRIRCDAAQIILIDFLLQIAADKQRAADVVIPDRLT